MINRNNKKGFTIVELVIVIAVIAILAAVLIPTFAGIIKKANESKDTQLVKNLNTALAADTEDHPTMQSALDAAAEFGYDLDKIVIRASGNDILWDSVNDVFVYLKDGEVTRIPEDVSDKEVADYQYWQIVKELPEAPKYSLYASDEFTATTVEVSVGFDAGDVTTIETITYKNEAGAKDVVIRTNGGKLVINDTNADSHQTHYGALANAEITTGTSCFYTHGKIASLDLKAGKAVVENGAYVGLSAAAAGTVVEEKGGLFFVADETNIDASVLETLNSVADRSYKIGSKAELIAFGEAWNVGAIAGGEFKLAANIDISGSNWAPIGNWKYPFNGTFNGNGHTISGLTAVGTCEDGIYSVGDSTGFGETFGLFGIVGNGDVVIKDLTLDKVNIDLVNGKHVAAIIGYAPSSSNFADAKKGQAWGAGEKWVGNTTVGAGAITLSNVEVSGTVSAAAHGAGLVGKVYSSGKITVTDCVNNASITSGNNCAGLVAYINGSTAIEITGSTNNGVVRNTASTGVNAAYFAVVHTQPNAYGNMIFKNNINNANCDINVDKRNTSYDPGFLTMSCYSQVKSNTTNDFSGNVDNGSLCQNGDTKISVPEGKVLIDLQ